jgi:tetratricopeptide (TPR) repeat protein
LRSELQKHPDDAERWAQLGRAYQFADAALAVEAFAHATRLAPNEVSYWKQLGEAHFSSTADQPTALQASEAAFLTCLQLAPQRGDCLCWLGDVYHTQGNHTAALQSYAQATEHGFCEYRMANELLELGDLEQSNTLVQARLAQTPARPGSFETLYVLHDVELQIALQRGDPAQAHAARQRLTEYAARLTPEVAFNLGSTYAVSRPPRPTQAKQLLDRFVQSSCGDSPAANDCERCVVARDLLLQLASPDL